MWESKEENEKILYFSKWTKLESFELILVNILFNSLNAKVTFIYLRCKSSDWFLYNGNFGI